MLHNEQCVQRENCYWSTVRDMSEKYRLTLSALRWNSPRNSLEWALPGREGRSRIPTLFRERERWGKKEYKKREWGKIHTKKPHGSSFVDK